MNPMTSDRVDTYLLLSNVVVLAEVLTWRLCADFGRWVSQVRCLNLEPLYLKKN